MKSQATTVDDYLKELPEEHRQAISTLRNIILKNLPTGYEEAMNWGMISYQVPLANFPDTYNGQPLLFAALASQKNHMAIYLMNIYGDKKLRDGFEEAYKAAGKKLNAGKSCVRFNRLEDLPLDLIGEVVSKPSAKEFIDLYQRSRNY